MGERMKFVVVGAGGVGKSALTIRFLQDKFVSEYDPTIEDTYRKTLTIDKKSVYLDILDTAGQEEYSSMRDTFYQNGDGFVIVYSLTSKESYEKVEEIIDSILRIKDADKYPMIVVGNKCDLIGKREISRKKVENDYKKNDITVLESSAKKNMNVHTIFEELVRSVRKSIKLQSLEEQRQKKKKSKRCLIM
ncbi:ras-like protein [Anaeramoeba flamelloides]|uniref:Ras-like protein n=1 Tax=Anaeramoeba flamelloides TaxID=1746091 RepID=A0AAV7YQW2_9EUKA|nr:ras-like protein [Anaeramoeba flamelloides]KAJ6253996.1 ras-like protein [Anaeramoeba flamelloides]